MTKHDSGVTPCGSYECKAAQRDGVLCADGECRDADGSKVGPPWCCEKGEAANVAMCPDCVEACAGYQAAAGVEEHRPLGCALAMRVLQSDLYPTLDDAERADCDDLVRQNLDWFKADNARGVDAPRGGNDGR